MLRNRWLRLNMTEKLFTGTLNHNQNKKNLPDNPPPRPRPPLPPPSISPHFFNCTMTGFLDSYLADLDPAFSKFHFYINSWSASTRPPPTSSPPPPKKKQNKKTTTFILNPTLTLILGSHHRLHFITCYV